jgi:putative membrane protein
MRKILSLTIFAALMALATGAATAAVSSAEKKFATEAAQGGVAEVEMGQLALQKATSPEVKQFAQRMVSDHTQANQELMQLAKSEGMDLPSQVDAKHKSAMERLQGMNGSAFDTAYMQSMVQDHERTLPTFRRRHRAAVIPG